MTTIYLIRHAEAEGNLYRRIQGHWNGQVTPRGFRQIEALAERFRDVPVDAVYSSDLQRTMDTAGAILKYHDLQLKTTPRLREANLGVWEGRPWGDVEYESPEQMFYFNHDPAKWCIPQCERFPEIQARMRAVLAEIAARHEGQTVAVVSHGVAIRSFLASALGIPSEQIDSLPHGASALSRSSFRATARFSIPAIPTPGPPPTAPPRATPRGRICAARRSTRERPTPS